MNHQTKSKEEPAMSRKMITSAVVLLLTLATACGARHGPADAIEAQPINRFPEATITIFPVMISITGPVEEQHRKFADALKRKYREDARELAGTLGLLLAEKGCDKFEVTDSEFRFPE